MEMHEQSTNHISLVKQHMLQMAECTSCDVPPTKRQWSCEEDFVDLE